MKKVALTGNIGCGKSTVACIFAELGAFTVDADEVIRSFYRKGHPVYKEVVLEFGREVLDPEGNIDRKKLADVVFKDKEKLRRLESTTHRALYEYLDALYKELPEDSVVVVEASLFIEKGTYKNYDKTVVVYAPYEVCRDRAIRKGFTKEDFERRWKNQMDIEKKVRYADFVIDNSGSLENTRRQVEEVFKRIKEDP
ncbi:MAG: dephospho-CoA kinase [Aquificota bacterium]|nr:dephospho-CoA kinase [Aquificota bacterium]